MRALALVLCVVLTACGPGEEGPAGPQGPQGPKGDSGVGLISGAICIGTLNLGNGKSVTASHRIYTFADESVFASCNVAGAADMSSSSAFHPKGSVGVPHAGCVVTFDLDTPSSGFWGFEANADRTSTWIHYYDSSSPLHRSQWIIPCQPPLPAQ